MIKFTLAYFVLFVGGLVIADNVPVLIWGPFDHYTPAIALKSYNVDEFIDILGEHITPDTFALVVSEDQLSTEDLSQCKTPNGQTCFQGIQQIKSKLYLASVEDPLPVIDDVAGLDKTEVTLSSNGALSEPLNAEGGKYVFINFEDDEKDEAKSTRLTRHDKLITNLFEELSSQNLKLMVIYTGRRSEHQRRIVRQVQQTTAASNSTASSTVASVSSTASATSTTLKPKQETATPPTFFRRPRMLLYFASLYQVTATGPQLIEISNVTVNEGDATKLQVTMIAGTNTINFNITDGNGYWWVKEISYNDRPLFLKTRIYALERFSFSCSPAIEMATRSRDLVFRWEGLQLQPLFSVEAGEFNSFGDAWDCVGFVSPGIVGGLFVVILLLFILSIGISWMMDINTMDRFDDPKGKTITISVNE